MSAGGRSHDRSCRVTTPAVRIHSAVTLYRHRPRCVCTSTRLSSASASIYMATASRCVCTSMVMRIDIEHDVYRQRGRVLYTSGAGCSCMPRTLHTHFCRLYMHCGAEEQQLDAPDKDSACKTCARSTPLATDPAYLSTAAAPARPLRPLGSREPAAATLSAQDPSRKILAA